MNSKVNADAKPELSWWRKAAVKFALKAIGQTYSLTDTALGKALMGSATYAGRGVNDMTAMQVSTVFGIVRGLSETVGSLPRGVFQREKNGNAVQVDHPIGDIVIKSPNSDMTDTEFFEASMTNLCLRGNGYSLKEFNGAGNVSSLYPIPARNATPKRLADGEIVYRIYDRGRYEDYPQEKIWHVKGFGDNGLVGYSPIAYARQAIGTALATEEFGARFFAQGAKPSGLISIPQWLDKDQRAIARENLQQLFAGLENAQKVQLLEGGMTYEPVTMPLEDAQFLQLRGFGVPEICRFYRYPPHMVADLARSTNNNIEQQSLEFVMYTLQPYLTRYESSALKWLFKPADRAKYFLRFDVDGLLRADSAARSMFYGSAVQNGYLNRNEVRAKEKLNRIEQPGMDDYTVQTNMTVIQLLELLGRAQAQAQTAPPAPVPPANQQEKP